MTWQFHSSCCHVLKASTEFEKWQNGWRGEHERPEQPVITFDAWGRTVAPAGLSAGLRSALVYPCFMLTLRCHINYSETAQPGRNETLSKARPIMIPRGSDEAGSISQTVPRLSLPLIWRKMLRGPVLTHLSSCKGRGSQLCSPRHVTAFYWCFQGPLDLKGSVALWFRNNFLRRFLERSMFYGLFRGEIGTWI